MMEGRATPSARSLHEGQNMRKGDKEDTLTNVSSEPYRPSTVGLRLRKVGFEESFWVGPGEASCGPTAWPRWPEAASCRDFLRTSEAETTRTSSSFASCGRVRPSLPEDDPRARKDSWEVDQAAATGATWEPPREAGGREVWPLGGRISFLAAGAALPPPTRWESFNLAMILREQMLKVRIGEAAKKKTWECQSWVFDKKITFERMRGHTRDNVGLARKAKQASSLYLFNSKNLLPVAFAFWELLDPLQAKLEVPIQLVCSWRIEPC